MHVSTEQVPSGARPLVEADGTFEQPSPARSLYGDSRARAAKLLLAAERGRGGEAYFATDGEPVVFREFMSELLEIHGVKPPRLVLPSWLPPLMAVAGEWLWTRLSLRGQPPVTFAALNAMGREVTVNDQKARRELGYRGTVSIEEGLARVKVAARE